MRCERTFLHFRLTQKKSKPIEVRCKRQVYAVVEIPFGKSIIRRLYCKQCAEERAAEVKQSRKRMVIIRPF